MAKKFRDLVAGKPAGWHAVVAARKRELIAEMPLHELRRALRGRASSCAALQRATLHAGVQSRRSCAERASRPGALLP